MRILLVIFGIALGMYFAVDPHLSDKAVCMLACGLSYAEQNPEQRDHLTCINGEMKPLNSDRGRAACTRFDGGPWAGAREGRWCVKVTHIFNYVPAQCLGLVPQE